MTSNKNVPTNDGDADGTAIPSDQSLNRRMPNLVPCENYIADMPVPSLREPCVLRAVEPQYVRYEMKTPPRIVVGDSIRSVGQRVPKPVAPIQCPCLASARRALDFMIERMASTRMYSSSSNFSAAVSKPSLARSFKNAKRR